MEETMYIWNEFYHSTLHPCICVVSIIKIAVLPLIMGKNDKLASQCTWFCYLGGGWALNHFLFVSLLAILF